MLEPLKPFYNTTLRPAARLFLRIGIHPNAITILGLFLFIAGGWFCAIARWHSALIVVILGSLMDGLDGLLARESGKQSEFGAILDSSCDRLTEMVLLGGIAVFYQRYGFHDSFFGTMLCFSALSGSVMVSYIKARCEAFGIRCSRGLLQRPERLILLCFGLLMGQAVMLWILGLITLAGFFTVMQRILIAAAGVKTDET
jgi:CDP-diacylglycerol--glycerol-3-phosphate 3-phosphatidyltransferase